MLETAQKLCGGKLVLVHEGGYSEAYVPFCGHVVVQELAGSDRSAPDPMAAILAQRQPSARFDQFVSELISEMAESVMAVP